jgi:invasion protein IalB
MSRQPVRSGSRVSSLAVLAMLFLTDFAGGVAYGQQKRDGAFANETSGQEVASRGQRAAREIKYSDWRKFCLERSGTAMVCRTSISGTFETGQSAVRIDLIEREGDKPARLQLFLPVGLYLQAGATIAIDGGAAWRIPYLWCLANTCVAAADAEPKLIEEMRVGKTLVLEVVDSSVLAVTTAVPVNGFAAARQGAPARTFEQAIDE